MAATYYPAGGTTFSLQSSVSSTQTTITLTSFNIQPTGDAITMALMNTSIAYGTIAPKTSQSEFISFTGVTANADGTFTLTGVTRGLDKTYPFTEDTDFKLPHAGGSQFILSDAPQVFNKYGALVNANTWSGIQTFSTQPISTAGLPTGSTDLATKAYVDNTATGTTNINRIIVAGTAGETIAVDQLVYLKASDGRWWLADADSAATSENVQLGIAQGAGSAAGAITSGVLISGLNTFSALTLTADTKYYVSNTAGGFSSTPGTKEVTVGESQTTTTFLFSPNNDQQITEDQQDALAGDNGTPSSANTYVTQTGLQIGAEVYAADAQASDTYVITLSPVPAAYVTGMVINFKANTVNTGAATINVNSLGAKTIVKGVNTTLADGDIAAGQIVKIIYDGTNFVLQNPVGVNTAVDLVPKMMTSTAFETLTRFTRAVTDSGAGAVSSAGYTMSTGAGTNGSSNLTMTINSFPYLGSPVFSTSVTMTDPGGGSNFTTFIGIGALTVATAGITYTGRHIGFKTVGLNLIATQGDGTTENVSGTLTTVTSGDSFDLIFKINGSASVDYYWRKNGGTVSAATNLTANLPAGTTTTLQWATSSNSSVNGLTLNINSASYER